MKTQHPPHEFRPNCFGRGSVCRICGQFPGGAIHCFYSQLPDAEILKSKLKDLAEEYRRRLNLGVQKAAYEQLRADLLSLETHCEACQGKGWLLVQVDGDPDNERIERCDACMKFATDLEAVAASKQ